MTPETLREARATLGNLWGLGRPLKMAELGRALRLGGRDPGESINDYERGKTRISGPLAVAVEMMLAGALPPDGLDAIKTGRPGAGENARNPQTFGAWLLTQTHRDDPVGDLARDAANDGDLAWPAANVQDAADYMLRVASDAALNAFKRAASEFTGAPFSFDD